MKILANKNSDDYDLAQYAGKDLWIKCDSWGHPAWVRILSVCKISNDFVIYDINEISDHMLESLLNPPDWSFYRIKDANHLPLDISNTSRINVVEPLEIKTTQELFNLPDYAVDTDTANIAEQIAGTNIYVLATNIGNHNDYYINIIEKRGNIIKYDCVESWMIDYPDDWGVENGPPSESNSYQEGVISHLDTWDFYTPMIILTKEEVDALFEQAEAKFWEDYNNQDADYEDEE